MFEVAVIRNPLATHQTGEFCSLGMIAETLLFYDQTHFILDPGSLAPMVEKIGFEALRRLLKSGHAKATYIGEMESLAFGTNDRPDGIFSFARAEPSPTKKGQKLSLPDRLAEDLIVAGVDPAHARKRAKELLELMPPSRLSSGLAGGHSLGDLFIEQLLQYPDITSQANILAAWHLPGAPLTPIKKFEILAVSPGYFRVGGDATWEATRKLMSATDKSPGHAVALGAYAAFIDFALSSRFGGDLVGTKLREELVVDQVGMAMHRRLQNASEIAQFNHIELGEGCGIAAAIDSGQRSFAEFQDILDKAQRFKTMLKGANPSVGLIKAYQDEVAKGSWLDRLAPKKDALFILCRRGAPRRSSASLGESVL